jgi:hypothetical protein
MDHRDFVFWFWRREMYVRVLLVGEFSCAIPHDEALTLSPRNGGHVNGPLFHDYAQLKSEFGLESAKRIIRFRLAHLPALREAVEDIGALDYSQVRDVEKLDVYFDRDTFEENIKALEEWKADMPEEAAGFCVVEGKEATQVLHPSPVGRPR